ncbi:EC1118_1N9_2520p [Saccharomyces cerevisiae EC1118]|uniref:Putative uncharacterized membrane protein YNL109W n=3 Tax=Saccharomyces cerevisiae TaxID=4932 RepID=YNK9_YEAST|nr:RecName: Full=Putative uncharacterized membrane protein YNL109W [Saccharomyces cerevisiae S288C]CAA93398.1 N1958 [Saccharomyces cerevisiae]CAA95987.1 unnamed protein product [Saccharomyces cerevisiae]CAY82494.1 EC1118_1N9_2520p [Saccharomyces cerevisiae EC1118]
MQKCIMRSTEFKTHFSFHSIFSFPLSAALLALISASEPASKAFINVQFISSPLVKKEVLPFIVSFHSLSSNGILSFSPFTSSNLSIAQLPFLIKVPLLSMGSLALENFNKFIPRADLVAAWVTIIMVFTFGNFLSTLSIKTGQNLWHLSKISSSVSPLLLGIILGSQSGEIMLGKNLLITS